MAVQNGMQRIYEANQANQGGSGLFDMLFSRYNARRAAAGMNPEAMIPPDVSTPALASMNSPAPILQETNPLYQNEGPDSPFPAFDQRRANANRVATDRAVVDDARAQAAARQPLVTPQRGPVNSEMAQKYAAMKEDNYETGFAQPTAATTPTKTTTKSKPKEKTKSPKSTKRKAKSTSTNQKAKTAQKIADKRVTDRSVHEALMGSNSGAYGSDADYGVYY